MPFQKKINLAFLLYPWYKLSIASKIKHVGSRKVGLAAGDLMGLWREKHICFICQIFSFNFISTENDIHSFAFFNIQIKVTGIKLKGIKRTQSLPIVLSVHSILAFSMDKLMLFTKIMLSSLTFSLPWINYWWEHPSLPPLPLPPVSEQKWSSPLAYQGAFVIRFLSEESAF